MSLLISALLLVQSPAAAAPADAEKPVSNKKICRIDTLDTGSRMKKRTCLTQAEWDRRDSGKSAGDLKNIGGR